MEDEREVVGMWRGINVGGWDRDGGRSYIETQAVTRSGTD